MDIKKIQSQKNDSGKGKLFIIHDVVSYVIVAYVAFLSFLIVDAKVQLANAQTEAISNNIAIAHMVVD